MTFKKRGSILVTVACFALWLLAGCRSESVQERPDEAPEASSLLQTDEATVDARVRPTEPVEPGSCLSGGCHQERLRTAFAHRPVTEGACDSCHLPEQPVHRFPVKTAAAGLCTACHDIIGAKAHLHGAIQGEGCLPCHDPHGSKTRFILTEMSTEMICQRCHRVERKQELHAYFASGSCTTCHEPHASDNRHLLIGGEGEEHCLACHADLKRSMAGSTAVHKPITETGCKDCHAHHSSDHESILVSSLYDLCIKCHPKIQDEISNNRTAHGAVFIGRRCSNCHDSHASDRSFLLREEELTLCLECHDRPQESRDGRRIPDMTWALLKSRFHHGPIRAGNCSACHYVHATEYPMLLRSYFPEQFYASFNLANYALCFTCHSNRIVLNGDSMWFTSFRDGYKNLHYVHVNQPDKGRTCRTCHELHGSNLPKHMASEVPFEGGGWAMPIRIEQTEEGGRCSPGCHEPREYRRSLVSGPGFPKTDGGHRVKQDKPR